MWLQSCVFLYALCCVYVSAGLRANHPWIALGYFGNPKNRNSDTSKDIGLTAYEDGIKLSLRDCHVLVRTHNNSVIVERWKGITSTRTGITQPYKALFGFYSLPLGIYVVMVKTSSPVRGLALLGDIHRVEEVELIRIGGSTTLEDELAIVRHNNQLNQLRSVFKRYQFLFSRDGYDILHRLQANLLDDREEDTDTSDDMFFWNKHATKELLCSTEGRHLVTKFVHAFATSVDFELSGRKLSIALIARRSRRFQGQRFIRRGGNLQGDVANFVEMEQILLDRSQRLPLSSSVQVRGSIPLRWTQPSAWQISPSIRVIGDAVRDHTDTVMRHLLMVSKSYKLHRELREAVRSPRLVVVNLVDRKGGQGALGRLWYEILLSFHRRSLVPGVKVPSIQSIDWDDRGHLLSQDLVASLGGAGALGLRYIWQDYHHKCKVMGAEASLRELLGSVMESVDMDDVVFSASKRRPQTVLIRTNCVDCLDRTNVVQTAISRRILIHQLRTLFPFTNYKVHRMLAIDPDRLPIEALEKGFRKMWAAVGDELSLAYAGSRAMKRDVTISGVRTRRGLLEDALAFARRYYTNNYRDQYKQIALDLFLGNGNDDWEDGLWSANPTATSSVNPVDNEDEMIFAPSSTPFRQINATDSFEGVLDEMFSQALDEFSDNNYNNVSVL